MSQLGKQWRRKKIKMKICNKCIWLGKQRKVHFYICLNSDSKFHRVPFPHSKVRKACNLYEPRDYPTVQQIIPEGMRLIEDLRGKEEFKDSDFWIIGSDPNLDCYPDDFFDDKFSIAVNLSCIGFPESTFLYMSGREELEWIISKYPDYLKKIILPLEPIRSELSAEAQKLKLRGIERWENWGLESIYMKSEDRPMLKSAPDYESVVRRILSDGPCEFAKVRTSIHWAIFAAAVLGAKKIILVGCSHKDYQGRIYAHKRGMGEHVSEGQEKMLKHWVYGSQRNGVKRMRRDTIQLAEIFKKYGIEVVRHRFDEEKQEFVFEEIKET